jgi:thiamine kinase-like enzyme
LFEEILYQNGGEEVNTQEIDTLLDQCLVRLGMNMKDVTNYKKIETGGSGATVIEVHLKNEHFILKFTSCQVNRDIYANAQHELRFYEKVSPLLNIRVPELIGSFEDNSFGIGICMHALKSTPVPAAWDINMIREAFEQIVLLHSAYWDREKEIVRILNEKQQQQRFEHRDHEIEISVQAWHHVYTVMTERGHIPPIPLEEVFIQLRNISMLADYESEVPCTLIHEDFHMENCLISSDDKIVITDWQSVSVGSGPTDIGYFLARSELFGNPISSDEIIDAYTVLLDGKLSVPVNRLSVERIIHSKRLSTHLFWSPRFVLYWPDYVFGKVMGGIVESSHKLGLLNLSGNDS